METSMLYELVQKLEKDESRQLKKYLRSPFITHREDTGRLFNCLLNYLQKGKPLPEKRVLFSEIFHQSTYEDQKLRSTMSDLQQLIEQYLIWKYNRRDSLNSQLTLAEVYRQRNLPKHFKRTIRKAEVFWEKDPVQNSDYYQNLLKYQMEKVQFQLTNSRAEKLNLQEIGDTIDVLYLSQKLRHICTQLSHRAVFQADYQFGLLEQWIDVLENSAYLKVPAIALYYYCYRFLTDTNSQTYFRKFRATLSTNQQHFPKDELKNLYRAALNFCIRKHNEGQIEYTREGWELYQEGLQVDIFSENNRLSRFTFDNIVGFGLRIKEYDEIGLFIQQYKEQLDLAFRESTVHFNLARLEYDRKNYALASSYIQASDPKDLVNKLIAKTLQLKIYFESEKFTLLDAHLDNFRLFIRRKEVSDYHRNNFQNIIYYTRKLIALAPYDKIERQKLTAAIKKEESLTERAWFLEKLLEMDKPRFA